MKKRVIAGIVISIILVGMFALRQFVFKNTMDIFILSLSCVCSAEIAYSMQKEKRADFRLVRSILAVLTNVALYFVFLGLLTNNVSLGWIITIMLFALVISVFVSLITYILIWAFNSKKKKAEFSIFTEFFSSLLCLTYPGVFLTAFYFLNHIAVFGVNISDGFAFFPLSMVFFISCFTDMFAMFGGTLFKGPKLCPGISPNKRVSGAIAGLIFGMGIAVATFFAANCFNEFSTVFINFNITWWKVLIISLIASVFSQTGDIFESFLKRKFGVKDMSNLIAGHGGFCDRLDGISICGVVVLISFIIMLL